MIEYIINSAVWSVGGLGVGFFLGRISRDVSMIKRKVTKNDETDQQV